MKWNFKWNYEWNFTSTFNTNYTWNVSHITHIFTKSASIVFDFSNVKVLLSMMSILVVKQMVLRKISHFLSIIVHVKFQVKLRMKLHFNFQYKFHMKCVSHYTYLHKKCFYCVWFVQFERIIINDEYFSGNTTVIRKDFSVFCQ